MSERLLPRLFQELSNDFKSEIVGRTVTLMIDGWKDIKNDPTLGFGLAYGGKDWLYKLEDTLGTRHTIENLARMVDEVC